MRAAKVQASLRIRAVSPEPLLLAHTSSESRGTYRQKARSLVPMNGWACAVKICHDGMLEDTNSLGGAHVINVDTRQMWKFWGYGEEDFAWIQLGNSHETTLIFLIMPRPTAVLRPKVEIS